MKPRQKVGLLLTSFSLLVGLILQKSGAWLYRPDVIQDIQIVPAPHDLTPILFLLATNWFVAAPLALAFIGGALCLLLPLREPLDEPQLIEIKYIQ